MQFFQQLKYCIWYLSFPFTDSLSPLRSSLGVSPRWGGSKEPSKSSRAVLSWSWEGRASAVVSSPAQWHGSGSAVWQIQLLYRGWGCLFPWHTGSELTGSLIWSSPPVRQKVNFADFSPNKPSLGKTVRNSEQQAQALVLAAGISSSYCTSGAEKLLAGTKHTQTGKMLFVHWFVK